MKSKRQGAAVIIRRLPGVDEAIKEMERRVTDAEVEGINLGCWGATVRYRKSRSEIGSHIRSWKVDG